MSVQNAPPQETQDRFDVLERADRAYHDVAQLHLHEIDHEHA